MLMGVLCVDLLIDIYITHVHVTCTGTAVQWTVCDNTVMSSPPCCANTAIARFCEAIIDFLADEQLVREANITAEQFHGEVFAAYEQLFNIWLQSKEAKVSCYTLYCVCPFITSYTVPIFPTLHMLSISGACIVL